jgi:hypothetical protein
MRETLLIWFRLMYPEYLLPTYQGLFTIDHRNEFA